MYPLQRPSDVCHVEKWWQDRRAESAKEKFWSQLQHILSTTIKQMKQSDN